jgi:choline-sulfatase
MAGGSLPPTLAGELDGHSLVPLIEGRPKVFQGHGVFCEFEGEGWNHPRCFLRAGNLKYVFNHTAPHELYDLEADPQELHNLAGQLAYATFERSLREQILGFWYPDEIEREVLKTQARQKIARCRNVCRDQGW